jgi:alkane 1-monooxygenase
MGFRRDPWKQRAAASGFLSILIAPFLLVLSCWMNLPFLTFGAVMLVFPLFRVVFGAVPPGETPTWQEWISTGLDGLSFVYAAALFAAAACALKLFHTHPPSWVDIVGWALSLWVTMLFATCVGHDLLHRRSKVGRRLGHIVAGIAGFPLLGFEHNRHHNLPGNTAAAEWPRLDESVWRFGLRRLLVVAAEAMGRRGVLLAGGSSSPTVRGIRLSTLTTLIMLGSFAIAGGWRGVVIYTASCGLLAFSIQVVTYMQHWGLGDDSCNDAKAKGFGWESDCRFQAWVTMGLSLHYAHHQLGSLPYYRKRGLTALLTEAQ